MRAARWLVRESHQGSLCSRVSYVAIIFTNEFGLLCWERCYRQKSWHLATGWMLAGWLFTWSIGEDSSRSQRLGEAIYMPAKGTRVRKHVWVHVWAEGVWSRINIIHCVFFNCDSFNCELWKNSQFTIKRISQSKPDLRYCNNLQVVMNKEVSLGYYNQFINSSQSRATSISMRTIDKSSSRCSPLHWCLVTRLGGRTLKY